MKSVILKLSMAGMMLAIAFMFPLRAQAQDGDAESRIAAALAEMNEKLDEEYGAETGTLFTSTPTDLVFTLTMPEEFPTDPDEVRKIKEELSQDKVKYSFVADMIDDPEFGYQWLNFYNLAVQTGRGFTLHVVDKDNTANRLTMRLTNEELKYAIDHVDEYRFKIEEIGVVEDLNDDLEAEADTSYVDFTYLDSMIAAYNQENDEKGTGHRMWRLNDVANVLFVVSPDVKSDAVECASDFAKSDDVYDNICQFLQLVVYPADYEYEWMDFFFVSYFLDQSVDFHVVTSSSDPDPVVIHIPSNQLSCLFRSLFQS